MKTQKQPLNDVSVVSSDEENPRQETEVEEEEKRTADFSEQDEGIQFEEGRPMPTDRPRDISPRGSSDDAASLGMIDESDEETMAKYERGAKEDAKTKKRSA